MRSIFADFSDLAHHTRPGERGPRVPLGFEGADADLTGLREGENVLLVEPGEIEAPGIVISEQTPEGRYWYGVVTAPWRLLDASGTPANSAVPTDEDSPAAATPPSPPRAER